LREPFLNGTKEAAPPPLANARHPKEKFCSLFLICARPIFSSKRKRKLFCWLLLLTEQSPKEKFCFPFRRNSARANQKQRTKLFFGVASVSERRRGGSVFPLKKGSRKVYNYSTRSNFFGNDCSARRVRRAPQGKIRFCFRRKIPKFAPVTI
jgi:hypothetical protein